MNLSREEQNRRYKTIRELMAGQGLDSLLIGGRGDYHGRGNLRYVTDFGVTSFEAYCVLPLEGIPILIGRHPVHLSKSKWILEFSRTGGPSRNPVEQVMQALVHFDRSNKVGIVGSQDISTRVYQAVWARFGTRLADAGGILDRLRSVKSPEEIEQMRMAATIGDRMVTAVRDMVHPGLRDLDIYGEVKRIAYQMGCEYSFDQIALGSMQKLFLPTGKRLEAGTTLTMYVTPAYEGYFSQVASTLPVTKFQPRVRKMREVWEQALEAAVRTLRPGKRVSDVYLAIAKVLSQAGYESHAGFCGHEIGLDVTESWYVDGSETLELRPGMTLALHPCLIEPGGDDFLAGYTYVITDTGSERLNNVGVP